MTTCPTSWWHFSPPHWYLAVRLCCSCFSSCTYSCPYGSFSCSYYIQGRRWSMVKWKCGCSVTMIGETSFVDTPPLFVGLSSSSAAKHTHRHYITMIYASHSSVAFSCRLVPLNLLNFLSSMSIPPFIPSFGGALCPSLCVASKAPPT